ncbi:DNA endonuclease SmrA [Shewanella livingstonensis]|uniref:DNA endonuclease SmrA n=1 Tax=Shewanella livingstonensis TaxID=150120 RepID=A0A3G8LWB6_9GAMM|nr:DNA endonuclease SmrA [Shewanella livingstonensis]AZG73445.1 DNA endonuclease SmrA [Shewanella livingstonensis]
MSLSDDELFLQEMADVSPLKHEHQSQTAQIWLNQSSVTDAQLAKRAAAEQHELLQLLPTDPYLLKQLEPDDVVSYKMDGIQDQVFNQLRLGKYRANTVLDLHQYRLTQARESLVNYVLSAYEHGERNLLVIHGKGYKSKPFPALMKSAVCHWLRCIEPVTAYHSANTECGGVGAVFVMLKKSQQKRIENAHVNRKGGGFR